MQRPRIIHLCLKDPTFVAAPTPTTDAAEMSRLASNDEHFWVVADRYQTLSKLFRVNSDAREAALSFYRARFPAGLGPKAF
ncbi:hypothetical protein B0O99DRAFT_621122 [Bisporella sp. PMI_857]|nr:hypothetical protein B0O99DRAFT_621122 [Bisporella sp. PMI_857]